MSFLEERHIKDPADPSRIDWTAFDRTLMEIVAGEAKEVVKATLSQLHPKKVAYNLGTLQQFTNLNVRRKLTELCKINNSGAQ